MMQARGRGLKSLMKLLQRHDGRGWMCASHLVSDGSNGIRWPFHSPIGNSTTGYTSKSPEIESDRPVVVKMGPYFLFTFVGCILRLLRDSLACVVDGFYLRMLGMERIFMFLHNFLTGALYCVRHCQCG